MPRFISNPTTFPKNVSGYERIFSINDRDSFFDKTIESWDIDKCISSPKLKKFNSLKVEIITISPIDSLAQIDLCS